MRGSHASLDGLQREECERGLPLSWAGQFAVVVRRYQGSVAGVAGVLEMPRWLVRRLLTGSRGPWVLFLMPGRRRRLVWEVQGALCPLRLAAGEAERLCAQASGARRRAVRAERFRGEREFLRQAREAGWDQAREARGHEGPGR